MKFKPGDRVRITYSPVADWGTSGDLGTVLPLTSERGHSLVNVNVKVDNKPGPTYQDGGWFHEEQHLERVPAESPATNAVDHPAHYGGGDNPYEAIKVIESWGLDFCLGNAVKYISRAGKKTANPEQDLEKAIWYLQRRLKQLAETTTPPKHLK